MQGWQRVRTLHQPEDPNHTQPTRRMKKKINSTRERRADYANKKALALLLNPASPTPSNTRVINIVP